MDNYNYQQSDNYQQYDNHRSDKRSEEMAIAALVLGIVGLVCSVTIVIPLICGGLAIILAILSKGGEMTTTGKGKAGMILGIISSCIGVFVFLFAIATTSSDSLMDEFKREYQRQLNEYYNGYDYDYDYDEDNYYDNDDFDYNYNTNDFWENYYDDDTF